MKIAQLSLLALAVGAAPLAARAGVDIGVSLGGPEVVIQSQPPLERVEAVSPSPGPGFIWIRGHWMWRHERWVWFDGHWDRFAGPGHAWIPGQWVARGNGWVWIEGHYAAQVPQQPRPGQVVEVIASEAPPAAIIENMPPAPGPEFFWIGGHWHWSGGWVWVRGYYGRHPHFHPGGGWEPGRWDHRGGSWVWHDGRWR